jgi:uncharacterized protein
MIESVRFEWNPDKAERNRRLHGISFETAALVFADPFAITELDRIEGGEHRWQTLGSTGSGYAILLVAHVYRDEADVEVIRIISARRAEPHEKKRYDREARPI